MKILLCGASGFIGRHLLQTFRSAGHEVVAATRSGQPAPAVAVDFQHDTAPERWLPRLAGIDAVVNAVGVLRDTGSTPMAALHSAAPRALFAAAAQAGVRKVVQVSALGVGGPLDTAYMRTKGEADDFLQASALDWTILRPSLVYGEDGDSAKMFRLLARLPLIGLPGAGDMAVQPVHIDDVAAAALISLDNPGASRRIIDCVGPEAMSYRAMLECYARQLGTRWQLMLPVPWPLMEVAARLGKLVPSSPLEPETLAMLKAGSSSDPAPFAALLGRAPRAPQTFIAEHAAA